MPYGARVLYDSVDISEKVTAFEITKNLEQYCNEINISIAEDEFFDNLDFSELASAPLLEVYTRTDTTWVKQGTFYLERPSLNVDLMSLAGSFWGRSSTACLGEPFAPKVTKVWESDTSFFAICEEMCDLCGFTWDDTYSEVSDFVIFAYAMEVDQKYPIEVITEILETAYGDSAFVTTNQDGHLCIKLRQYSPSSPTETITDPISVSIAEEPEWPEFGNRVKLMVTGAAVGYNIQLEIEEKCLLNDGSSSSIVYARVANQEGTALNDIPVTWESEEDLVTFENEVTTTGTFYIYDEIIEAASYYRLKTRFTPSLVYGVYAYLDINHTTNLAGDGYTINDEGEIVLTSSLKFCDQKVRVCYDVRGIATNKITAGITIGNDLVRATVFGNSSEQEVYIGNPCDCPPTLTIEIARTPICVGDSTGILIYGEIGGAAITDNRWVYMSVASPSHGALTWTQSYFTNILIEGERCSVQNDDISTSRCNVSKQIYSVTSVYLMDDDGNPTGSNLYSSFSGKTIVLNTQLATGVELYITYTAQGCSYNFYTGMLLGRDYLTAYLNVAREEPVSATTTVTVAANCEGEPEEPTDPDPPGCCNEGLCEVEESICGTDVPSTGLKVRGMKDGAEGCWDLADVDQYGGKYRCWKDGVFGLYDEASSCDPCEENQKYYGTSEGAAGCYTLDELDTDFDQTTGEQKYAGFKDGVAGWYIANELDTGADGGLVECPPGTKCCRHKTSGLMGCYAPTDCDGSTTGPQPNPPKDKPFKPGTKDCLVPGDGYTNDTYVECEPPKQCCTSKKTNKKGCFDKDECKDQPNTGCYPTDCSNEPASRRDTCVSGRFASAAAKTDENGQPCTCEEMCMNELAKYGTTQGYSSQPISVIIENEYGAVPGDEGYDELWNSFAQSALEDCLAACGECEKVRKAITVSGPSQSVELAKPGGYQYYASGGFKPYTWTVSGTGATINNSGYMTLSDDACGTVTVTATDACGVSDSYSNRIAGGQYDYAHPAISTYSASAPDCSGGSNWIFWTTDIVEGVTKCRKQWQGYKCCDGGKCSATVGSCSEQSSEDATPYSLCIMLMCESDSATWYNCLIQKKCYPWIC